MKLLFGKLAVMLLEGSRVSSDKIENAGFRFLYPDLDSALKELYTL
jgi:NAD dependent epimerase/dehydratase family enzyme